MFDKNNISTRLFVIKYRNLFEDVAKDYTNMKDSDDVEYTILDYEKILSEMCDFIEGYVDYKKKGDNKYAGKILSTTINFYNTMFTDTKKYRHVIVLSDMKEITKTFLSLTNRLQKLIEDLSDASDTDRELYQLLKLSDNQYKKISKVYKDDLNIFLWLNLSNSKVYNNRPSLDIISAFHDESTPVIHRK